MIGLPICPFLPEILDRLRASRAVVIVAAPGAGKTTRVPPALAADGRVLVLQPRRIAARSIARRIADERRWTIGREVGWHVRFERQFTSTTRVILATEGVLTARAQADPLLSEFQTIILDEFHERSIHADLGLAFAKQAWLARGDLRLGVMSATMDAVRVAAFLGGSPIVEVPGKLHPVEIRYRPDASLTDAVREAAADSSGHVLCFLPGAPEISRALPDLAASTTLDIVPLHGSLDATAQDAAIASGARRRILLATNIAETSLTVPDVTAVIDTGLHKVARYDPARAIDSLETERISRDSADQRAGRAARERAGLVIRLWHEADRLRAHREPDVNRIDLAGPLLDILAWGGDPSTFEWFDAPPKGALAAASVLLDALGATRDGALTSLGRRMGRLPIHPRLARILLEADGAREAALACAVLAERHSQFRTRNDLVATTSDVLSAIEEERRLPPHVLRVADALQSVAGSPNRTSRTSEADLRLALYRGYADRLGKRRAPGSPRVLLASGHGATIGVESGVRDGEFIVALDVAAGARGEGAEARIRLASLVEREWLAPTYTEQLHEISPDGTVRACSRDRIGAIVLTERAADLDPQTAARMLADAYLARGFDDEDEQTLRRLKVAGVDIDARTLVERAAYGRRALRDVTLRDGLSHAERASLALAPESIQVPSGRHVPLAYDADGSATASVKLQELFGLAETPRVGPRREPVLLALLAPNGRPVQMTRDLRSFWERTYPEVRKELRGRYPKHPWPEDPWTAEATARTKKRLKG
jgi:ATP-dependent RNA helicase HrpB